MLTQTLHTKRNLFILMLLITDGKVDFQKGVEFSEYFVLIYIWKLNPQLMAYEDGAFGRS
jgi:hypothetical protein